MEHIPPIIAPQPISPGPLARELPPRQVTPSLDEILYGPSHSTIPLYNLPCFSAFLARTHRAENLEFVLEATRYLCLRGPAKLEGWARLYRTFLTPDSAQEVNLPYRIRDALRAYDDHVEQGDFSACDDQAVLEARKIIKVLLADAYLEFSQTVRRSQSREIFKPEYRDLGRVLPSRTPLTTPESPLTNPGRPCLAHLAYNPIEEEIGEAGCECAAGQGVAKYLDDHGECPHAGSRCKSPTDHLLWGMKKVGRKLISGTWRRSSGSEPNR